jgi:hypothetical protein
MPDSTAILFQTHYFDAACHRVFRRLADRCLPHHRPVVVIHLAPGAAVPPRLARVPHHIVRTDELRALPYPAKARQEGWNLWAGGHTDLIPLHYFRAHPGHDRYWVVEYDVRYSGDWRTFLAAFEEDDTDLLLPGLIGRLDDPDWYNWPSFQGPEPIPPALQLRGFLPVYRASARLMRHMDACYAAGWGGHCEGTWPTLARLRGMSIADPGGHGAFTPERYRGRFYSCTPEAVNLAPGTLVFKPPLYRMGSRKDMLWHPVKPFWWRPEIREGLRDIRRRIGIVVRGLAELAGVTLPPILQPGAMEARDAMRRGGRQ